MPKVKLPLHDDHFRAMWTRADEVDRREGLLAYQRYHRVMMALAQRYSFPLDRTIAAFVSLSPNSDYLGNLRSTVSCMAGLRAGILDSAIVIATYNHCRNRALAYLRGDINFLEQSRGLKIINFYHNILDPLDPAWVTLDGHMVGAWCGLPLTMKEALISRADYPRVKAGVCAFAKELKLLPNQVQATVWFARKRYLNARYSPQLNLFDSLADQWRSEVDVNTLHPFPFKTSKTSTAAQGC